MLGDDARQVNRHRAIMLMRRAAIVRVSDDRPVQPGAMSAPDRPERESVERGGNEPPLSAQPNMDDRSPQPDEPQQVPEAAQPAGADAALRRPAAPLPGRDAQAASLEAALLDSARELAALQERYGAAGGEIGDMLGRCSALLARAGEAAGAQRAYVAWDCLQQIERERVAALTDDERSAEMALALAESRALPGGWRQDAAEALAASARGQAPTVAALRAMLRNVHAARQERRHRLALVRQQLPVLATLLAAAVVFFALWGLLGGFDWLARDDVEVTVGMILVSGVLMGYFGGLVSFAFDWLRTDIAARSPDRRTQRWLSLTRPLIGAAVAVPIVLFVEAGLINLGQLSPALVLVLCFFGGFAERRFVARIDRIAGGRSDRA
jgi:hypothetical protein